MLARHRTHPMTAHRHIHWPMSPTTCTPCDGLQTRGTLFGAVSARLPSQACHKQKPHTHGRDGERLVQSPCCQAKVSRPLSDPPCSPAMVSSNQVDTDVFMYCTASYYPPHKNPAATRLPSTITRADPDCHLHPRGSSLPVGPQTD